MNKLCGVLMIWAFSLISYYSLAKEINSQEVVRSADKVENKPVYLVAQLTVPDPQKYRTEYAGHAVKQLEKIGAEVIAADTSPTVLEGKLAHPWSVIIKFPSESIALRWYESAEYKELQSTRINKLNAPGNLVLVPGL